jgi:hypothetical protein
MKISCLALVGLLAAVPATAQQWQVARDRFPFGGSRLKIRVEADARGTLRVIRGAPGSVRVAGRAEQGFTAAGLADNDQLTLTAAGEGPVDYMVSVPQDVWIDVQLPGSSFAESIAGRTRSRTFEWTRPEARSAAPVWVPPTGNPSLYTTYTRDVAPQRVTLPVLSAVRSLGIRIEDGPFRVRTGRPLSVERGDDDRLEIRADQPPMDILITLPAGTRDFRLEAGGAIAVAIADGQLTVRCSPVTDQRLSHGRRWLTFTPVDGSLSCAP